MLRLLLVLVLAVPLAQAFCCFSARDVTDVCGTCNGQSEPGEWCHDAEHCARCSSVATWCGDNVEGSPTAQPSTPVTKAPVSPPDLSPVARFGALAVDNVKKRLVSKATGETVQLVGMSLFWSNKGWRGDEYWNADVVHELATKWPGLSIIRASVGVEDDGGYLDNPEHTLSVLRTVVDAAIAEGLYVIVCWHSHDAEFNAVKQRAKEFFPLITEEYGGVPNVLYNIYNEPEPHTLWSEIKAYAEEMLPFVREHAPDAVVLVGTEWWAQRPAATVLDPITSDANIIYGVHFYAAWAGHNKNRQFLRDAVDEIPIIIDEWGQGCPHIECDPIEEETQTWMTLLDEFQLSHVNWVLNDKQDGPDYSLSALNAYASTAGGWTDQDFTEAGASTKAIIARYEIPETAAPTVTPRPTSTPTSKPTSKPNNAPTGTPTSTPTSKPTSKPNNAPTGTPTSTPTSKPTHQPTPKPTDASTDQPTNAPGQTTAAPTPKPTSKPTDAPTDQPTSEPTDAPPTSAPPSDADVSVTLIDQGGYTLTTTKPWTFTRNNIDIEISNNEAAVMLTHVEVDVALECPAALPDCAYFKFRQMHYPGFTDVDAVLADNDNPIGYHFAGSDVTLWGYENVGYFVKSQETGKGRFVVEINSELNVDFDVSLVATVKGKTSDSSAFWTAPQAKITYSVQQA